MGARINIIHSIQLPLNSPAVRRVMRAKRLTLTAQVIEVLSFLKMAHLHWHLTDDVSFALPITALPDRIHPMYRPTLPRALPLAHASTPTLA